MTRRSLVGWFSIAAILGLVFLGAIFAHRYRWELRRLRSRLEATSLLDMRIGTYPPDSKTEIRRSGDLRLVAREYHPAAATRATILLLHGNTPRGSNLAFYRVLGHRLADAGYFVLAPDFAGFGESGDPFSILNEGDFSGDFDVRAWLEYLSSDPRMSGKALYVIAHSAGVSSGMPIGLGDERVSGIIAIGPSRRVIEDLADPGRVDYWWRRTRGTYREVYGRELPVWYTKERWLSEAVGEGAAVGMKRPMEYYLQLLQARGHHPVLLVDGEREPAADKDYLEAYYEAMAEPKDYHTLARSDHYSNVAHVGPWAIYDQQVVEDTVSQVDNWINETLDASESETLADP